MSTTKHTPGPWTVLDGSSGLLIEQRVRLVDFDSGVRPLHVAFVATSLNPSPRAEADARLISTSPDLFELASLISRLETEEETLERTGDNQSGDDAVEALSGLIHKARALVARAEGRS